MADPEKHDIESKATRGGALTLIGRALRAPVELVSLVVLARLLAPEDFGRIAMVTSITAFVTLFRDLGLTMVTIQRPELTEGDKSTLFWLNMVTGTFLTGLTMAMAPILAWFFGYPELLPLTLVLAPQFLLGSAGAQHLALLRRELKLGAEAMLKVAGSLAGLIVAVSMAAAGTGFWAIAGSMVTTVAVVSIGAWVANGWRPQWAFDRQRARSLIGDGANLTGFHFANYFARNLDDVLIGATFGATALGFYQKAYQLLTLPLKEINAPAGTVAIPAMSRLVDEPQRYRDTYRAILQKVLLITTPLGALLIACPEWVLETAFGKQWVPAGAIVAQFGLLLFTQPIGNSTGWLFISQGRTQEMFRWGLVGAFLAVISFFIGLPWGTMGVAAAYALSGVFIRLPALLWYLTRRGPVTFGHLFHNVRPFILAGALAWTFAASFRYLVDAPAWLGALVSLLLAATGSFTGLAVLPSGREVLRDLSRTIRTLRQGSQVAPAAE